MTDSGAANRRNQIFFTRYHKEYTMTDQLSKMEIASIVEDARVATKMSCDCSAYMYKSHIARLLSVIEHLQTEKKLSGDEDHF
jgi:hypothetical protein